MKNFSETISEIRHSSPVLGIVIRIAIGLLICGVCHGQSVVNFAMTNRLTNLPDTNFFRVFSINDPVLAHGGIQTKGPATLVYPNTNGLASLTLLAGYYQMTNAYLGQGILFLVPGDAYTYNVTDLAISGYNTYNTTGVRKLSSTNSSFIFTPANGVGNVDIEYFPGGGPGSFTTAGTNAVGYTNGPVVTINGREDTNVWNALFSLNSTYLANVTNQNTFYLAQTIGGILTLSNQVNLRPPSTPGNNGGYFQFFRPSTNVGAGLRWWRLDDPVPTHSFSWEPDMAGPGDFMAFFDSIITHDVFQIGLGGSPYPGRFQFGGGGLDTASQIFVSDIDTNIQRSFYVLSKHDGSRYDSLAPYSDAITLRRYQSPGGNWLHWLWGDSTFNGTNDWRAGYGPSGTNFDLIFYTANGSTSTSSVPGLEAFRLIANGGGIVAPRYVGLVKAGEETNAAGSAVAYLSDVTSSTNSRFVILNSGVATNLTGWIVSGNWQLNYPNGNNAEVFDTSGDVQINTLTGNPILQYSAGNLVTESVLLADNGGSKFYANGTSTRLYDNSNHIAFEIQQMPDASMRIKADGPVDAVNGVTNETATASTVAGYDANKKLNSITIGSGLLFSGNTLSASGAATNVINVAVNTNAVAVTNGSGLLVTISGVTDTNVVNILSASQALIATNGLASGAFTPSNTVWLASSNLVYQGTNGLTTGAFTPSNTVWIASSNLVYQGTNALASGAYTSSNTLWLSASNLVQQSGLITNGESLAVTMSNRFAVDIAHAFVASNALASSVAGFDAKHALTNITIGSGLSFDGTTLTATNGGGGGPGLPGTNTVVAYGDQYRTNAEAISSGGTVFSNAVGTVQLGSGGIWWTNAKSGNWGWITNDAAYFSNYVTGMIMTLTNASVTLSNTTAAGVYSILGITNLTLSPGSAGAINLLAADGATQIGNWTNGGIWASNPISAPAYTNSGLLSAAVLGTDANGKQIANNAVAAATATTATYVTGNSVALTNSFVSTNSIGTGTTNWGTIGQTNQYYMDGGGFHVSNTVNKGFANINKSGQLSLGGTNASVEYATNSVLTGNGTATMDMAAERSQLSTNANITISLANVPTSTVRSSVMTLSNSLASGSTILVTLSGFSCLTNGVPTQTFYITNLTAKNQVAKLSVDCEPNVTNAVLTHFYNP